MIDLSDAGSGLQGYELLAAQLQALLSGERDFIANAAQFSAFLYSQLEDLNWAGFYLNKDDELVLGPFQGQVAVCVSPLAVGSVVLRHKADRPNGSKTCMRFPVISLATAPRIANWSCR